MLVWSQDATRKPLGDEVAHGLDWEYVQTGDSRLQHADAIKMLSVYDPEKEIVTLLAVGDYTEGSMISERSFEAYVGSVGGKPSPEALYRSGAWNKPRESVDVNSRALQAQVISASWPYLASFSYRSFLSYGKGAVEIDLAHVRMKFGRGGETDFQFTPNYIPESDEKLQGEEARQIMYGYNPERSVVFLFIFREPAPDGYRTAALIKKTRQPSPKELHDSPNRIN